MLTVTFIIHNPKTFNMVIGWGFIVMLFLAGNYLMIRSFRRIWADRLIRKHRKRADDYIQKALEEKDPWLIKLIFSISPHYQYTNVQAMFYHCIWDYERMIKDYSVWKLDKMVANREFFDRMYKKDFVNEAKNKKPDI